MKTWKLIEPIDHQATGWRGHTAVVLLGLATLLSIVLSFAVEFMAVQPGAWL